MSATSQIMSAIITIGISFVALAISFIALWKTTFSKFSPIFTAGQLRFRIYPIRSERERWFLPSVDLPISIANDGARPGRVLDIRLVVKFPKLPIKDHYEFFQPKWEVDNVKFQQIEKDRFQWINDAVLADWMSFIVLPKETITKHLILESRWDKPVIQKEVIFDVEILTDSSKDWKNIGEWKLFLDKVHWSELTENGTSIVCLRVNDDYKSKEPTIFPADLHKYTGTDELIPPGGFKAGASYLDYPKVKKGK